MQLYKKIKRIQSTAYKVQELQWLVGTEHSGICGQLLVLLHLRCLCHHTKHEAT